MCYHVYFLLICVLAKCYSCAYIFTCFFHSALGFRFCPWCYVYPHHLCFMELDSMVPIHSLGMEAQVLLAGTTERAVMDSLIHGSLWTCGRSSLRWFTPGCAEGGTFMGIYKQRECRQIPIPNGCTLLPPISSAWGFLYLHEEGAFQAEISKSPLLASPPPHHAFPLLSC